MSHKGSSATESSGPALGEPLVDYVCRQLREQIRSGCYRVGACIPSVRDLSAELEISRDTVRRAAVQLVREGVLEHDASRRFRVSDRMRESWLRTMNLTFVAPGRDHIVNGVFQVVYDVIQREATSSQVQSRLKLMLPDDKADARDLEGADIILAAGYTAKSIAEASPAAPVVGINALPGPGLVRSIHTDYFAGGQMAARHLYELGYRNVGVITTDAARTGEVFELRNLGFRKAWIDCGGRLHGLHGLNICDANQAKRIESVRTFIQAHPEVEAYFGVTDELALVACDVLESLGRSIPEDVGVVGFDGSHEALLHQPALTTLRQGMDEMAIIALRQCRLLFNGNLSGDSELALEPKWVPGGSVRKLV